MASRISGKPLAGTEAAIYHLLSIDLANRHMNYPHDTPKTYVLHVDVRPDRIKQLVLGGKLQTIRRHIGEVTGGTRMK